MTRHSLISSIVSCIYQWGRELIGDEYIKRDGCKWADCLGSLYFFCERLMDISRRKAAFIEIKLSNAVRALYSPVDAGTHLGLPLTSF